MLTTRISLLIHKFSTFSLLHRMYPVVIGNGRSLQSDAVIGGYHIPKGVIYFCYYIHKR